MSEADRLFEELGYRKYSEDEDKIIYKYDGETFRISLRFDKRSFKKHFMQQSAYGLQMMMNGIQKNLKTNGINIMLRKGIGRIFGMNLICKNYKQ